MIEGIAFDLEGTVVDVEAAHHNGHLAAAAEFGLTLSLDEAYAKIPHFIGGPREKICEDIRNLLAEDTRKRLTVEEIATRDEFHYERLLTEIQIEPRPGVLDFIWCVSRMGLQISIGSLTATKQANILLERSNLWSVFGKERIVLREHVKNVKPMPDVFLKTAELMIIKPSEQLVFEDSPRGVQAALTAGSKAIGMPVVLRGITVGALVDAGVSRIFYDWREIDALALIRNLG